MVEEVELSLHKKNTQVLKTINAATRGDLESFLVGHDLCSVCLENGVVSRLRLRNGERVCIECGYVPEQVDFSNRIPFGNVRTPVNQLAFGRGLGNTLWSKGRFFVLAHGIGTHDLPIRSKQISIITRTVDPPKIMRMLRLGSKLCHDWGFDSHKERKSVIFSNDLGRMLRTIGADIIMRNEQVSLPQVVKACFVLKLKAMGGAYVDAMEKLGVDVGLLGQIEQRYNQLKGVYR